MTLYRNGTISDVNPTTVWTYDADGNIASTTDPDGNTTNYYYDADDRMTEMLQPAVLNPADSDDDRPETSVCIRPGWSSGDDD